MTIGHQDHPGCMAWNAIAPGPFRVESLQSNRWHVSVDDIRRLVSGALDGGRG